MIIDGTTGTNAPGPSKVPTCTNKNSNVGSLNANLRNKWANFVDMPGWQRLAHSYQTFRNQVAQELLVIVWT